VSLRREAREFADAAVKQAIDGLFGLIERRIEWRRAHPHRLALEHGRMVYLLQREPGFVPFRKARIRRHRRLEMKHASRAWAVDHELASRCGVCLVAMEGALV